MPVHPTFIPRTEREELRSQGLGGLPVGFLDDLGIEGQREAGVAVAQAGLCRPDVHTARDKRGG